MGREMVRSHFSSVSLEMPSPSEPMTRATGPVRSAVRAFSPSMAVPMTHTPASFSASLRGVYSAEFMRSREKKIRNRPKDRNVTSENIIATFLWRPSIAIRAHTMHTSARGISRMLALDREKKSWGSGI